MLRPVASSKSTACRLRVKEIPMKQPSGEYTVDLAKGYYIVRIGDTVRKVSIR